MFQQFRCVICILDFHCKHQSLRLYVSFEIITFLKKKKNVYLKIPNALLNFLTFRCIHRLLLKCLINNNNLRLKRWAKHMCMKNRWNINSLFGELLFFFLINIAKKGLTLWKLFPCKGTLKNRKYKSKKNCICFVYKKYSFLYFIKQSNHTQFSKYLNLIIFL